MSIFIPPLARTLFYISVPLFLLHVIEEYLTLYYPTLFGVTYRTATLPQAHFIRVEAVVITVLLILTYLLYKKRLPGIFMLLPGLLYLYQSEHIYHTYEAHTYYPGIFTGLLLFILGIFFWISMFGGNRIKISKKKKSRQ